MIDNDVFIKFKFLIQNHCGMMITDVHSQQLEKYLSSEISRTGKSCEELYNQVIQNKDAMVDLINAVVINETYFFREERQFKFLENHIKNNFYNKNIVIWSAASSSGEEAYSLTALAFACHAIPVVYATDIDTDAISHLKNAVYGQNSFRPDGKCFMPYLQPYMTEGVNSLGQTIYTLNHELTDKIISGPANLLDLGASVYVPKDESVDIIFIRNVFIYFDKETRDKILKSLAKKLKKGGLLFFSVSEIAGINPDDETIPLQKCTKDSIYYFEKNDCAKEKTAFKISDNKRIEELLNSKTSVQIQKPEKQQPKTVETISAVENQKSPEQMWSILTNMIERKNYSEAQNFIDSFNPSVNQLYTKYYYLGFIHETQKDDQKALDFYEKAGISNPHFWPAFYKTAFLLQEKQDSSSKRKRHDALLKAAMILEKEKNESYNYLMGSFNSSYFYQLCNEYLKKEFS